MRVRPYVLILCSDVRSSLSDSITSRFQPLYLQVTCVPLQPHPRGDTEIIAIAGRFFFFLNSRRPS